MRKIEFVKLMMAAVPGCRISHAAAAWETAFADAPQGDGESLITAAIATRAIVHFSEKYPPKK